MSQYGSMSPPSPYVPPPNQGKPPTPHQQQLQHQAPPYQTGNNGVAAGFGPKSGGIIGQMVNQHLSNGKPMLNKLGKSLSSRFGNIPFSGSTSGTTQPVQSYQTHQGQYGQANQTQPYQQPTGAIASPQPQHQQQQHHHHQHQHQQHQQQPPPPQQQQQQQQQWGQAQHPSPPPPTSPYQQHAHSSPYQQSGYFTAAPTHTGQPNYSPQHTQPSPVSQSYTPPLPSTTSSYYPTQQGHTVEQGQTYGHQGYGHAGQNAYQAPAVQELQGSWAGQESGVVANVQSPPGMPNGATHTPPPMTAQSPQHTQSTWGSSNVATSNSSGLGQQPSSPMYASQHGAVEGVAVSQEQQHQHWTSTAGPVSPTFAVELPADLESLQLSPKPLQVNKVCPNVGASGEARTGMWKLADAATESPTDEFYVLADLLFDALDAKFEPRNTGLLEGSKVMGSGLMKLSDDEKRVFSHQSYSAFAKMWSVEGIPHVMVPCQAALAPIWSFSKQTHGQHVRVSESSGTSQTSYTPALNRAGWYKFLFVEAMRAGESLGEAMAAVCADSYQAGTAGHPDVNKLDRTVDPALRARAGELRAYAIAQACEETRAVMAASR